jgi:hypothetical protein
MINNKLIQEGRVGKFTVSAGALRDFDHERWLEFAGNFLIVRAEHMFVGDRIEYTAYSPLFEPGKESRFIPDYALQLTIDVVEDKHGSKEVMTVQAKKL